MSTARKWLVSIAVLLSAGLVGAALSARLHAFERTYYDESGQRVGEEVYPCYGPTWRWGEVTEHVTELPFRCLGDGAAGN